MFRIDIVGLTLAETALALLFAFMVAATPAVTKVAALESEREKQSAKEAQIQRELDNAKKRVEELQSQELQRQYSAPRPELRSRAIPSCIELGKAHGPVFETTIRGRDTYEINGETVTLDKLVVRNRPALNSARADGCKQTVQVYCGKEVAGTEYEAALRRLESYFYTRKSGPK